MKHCMGNESLHQTELKVPVPLVAYISFMDSVDRFNQIQSTNLITQEKLRVPMNTFELFLEVTLQNAYALMKAIKDISLLGLIVNVPVYQCIRASREMLRICKQWIC